MPILRNPLDLLFHNLFFEVGGVIDRGRLLLKLEGHSITGSIKIKSALFMMDDLERRGAITPQRSVIVESSSGNLGLALALICNLRGYGFICVTDPNISSTNRRGIEAYGGKVVVVERRDPKGGYLETRLAYIRDLLARQPDHVWLNQYANPANLKAHANWTALEILSEIPSVTHLYVGSGTTGTLMGLARRFAELSPDTELVAVEPEGSVTFDPARQGRRLIPGIGTSRAPEIADARLIDRVVYVEEVDAVRMCHRLARQHGLLLGGSSGSVMAAIAADAALFTADSLVVGISPDLGDKYLDTIYAPEWVAAAYGAAAGLNGAHHGAPPPWRETLGAVMARHRPPMALPRAGAAERRAETPAQADCNRVAS